MFFFLLVSLKDIGDSPSMGVLLGIVLGFAPSGKQTWL